MIDQAFTCPRVRARLRRSLFGDLLDEYVAQLQTRGYSRNSICKSLGAVEHFGSWLHAYGHSLSEVNAVVVHSFLHKHLPKCRCPRPSPTDIIIVRPALNYLLRLMQDREGSDARAGVRLRSFAGSVPSNRTGWIQTLLDSFCHHLRETRGLAEATTRARAYFARKFLEKKFGQGPLHWKALRADDVLSFVTDYTKRWRSTSASVAIDSLRSFLRYLEMEGRGPSGLASALPRLATWRLAGLPRVLSDAQLTAFLAAFDQATATGRRDYAMALCQVDLGLRACEVAALRLEDLDWRSATLRLPAGKSGRGRELPLAARAGRAIADYLRHGRPTTRCRQVFVRHRLLHGTPLNTSVIQTAMHRVYAQVPGCEHWCGTHALRHTAATRLYCRGAKLKEVADLLGHRSLDTTAIYTKVNLPQLTAVALPWPEVKS